MTTPCSCSVDIQGARTPEAAALLFIERRTASRDTTPHLKVLSSVVHAIKQSPTYNQIGHSTQIAAGNTLGVANELNNLAVVAQYTGDYLTATKLHEEALTLYRQLGSKPGIAMSLSNLADVARRQDQLEKAQPLYDEALALYRDMGHVLGTAAVLTNLRDLAMRKGEYRDAQGLLEEGLAMARPAGASAQILDCLASLGVVAANLQLHEVAVQLLSAVTTLCGTMKAPLLAWKQGIAEQALAQARHTLSDEGFSAAWARGTILTLDEAAEFALQLARQCQ